MDNIIKKTYVSNDIEIYTDIGWIPIEYVHKTIPLRKFLVLFESGIEIKCANRHSFIDINGNTKIISDLNIGDKIKSKNGFDIIFDILDYEIEEEMYDLSLFNHPLYYTNSILSHNSTFIANIASRQVLNGHNVVLLTLEMSEDAFAQRYDSIFTNLDINRIYISKDNIKKLLNELKKIKDLEGRGNLFIKQFPTGEASATDFRIYLRELAIRDIKPDIIYADYLNLMKPSYRTKGDMYSDVKGISEELRALSFEFKCPVISVSQLNREGSKMSFADVDFFYISESIGVAATADFAAILGIDEDMIVYQNELHYKIEKNRLGGRVGEIGRLYYDSRSLRIYDSTELERWLNDVSISGDDRSLAEQRNNEQRRGRGRR